jgi:hypothetical protein
MIPCGPRTAAIPTARWSSSSSSPAPELKGDGHFQK